MTLIGFRAQGHPQQRGRLAQLALFGERDDVDDRAITVEDFAAIADRHGPFTVDAAAAEHNARCARYWTMYDDGLAQPWAGERVWCNPPYSDIGPWVAKANHETGAELVVMLLPANRTEQLWWQHHIEPHRDRGGRLTVEFLPGRMRFLRRSQQAIGPNERPPFGCCLAIWRTP